MRLLLLFLIVLFTLFVLNLLYKKDKKKLPPSLTIGKPSVLKRSLSRLISPYTNDQLLTEKYPWANNNSLNQGECGSCWAFATAKAIAFAYRRYYGLVTNNGEERPQYLYQAVEYTSTADASDLTNSQTIKNTISPFYIGACTKVSENLDPKTACRGATLEEALEYVKNNPVISVLFNPNRFQYICPSSFPSGSPPYGIEEYSHLGYDNGILNLDQATLQAEQVLNGDFFTAYNDVNGNKMEGYILAAISVNSYFYDNYDKNIILSSDADIVNHAVIIVGYGTLNGVNYWLVHNSWGNVHNPPIPYNKTDYRSYFMIEKGKNCLSIESNMYAIKIKPFNK